MSETFEVSAADKTQLTVEVLNGNSRPGEIDPSRVLVIVHGLSEHGGRYRHLPHYLSGQFSRFYLMDLRGHGRSQGLRGDCSSFDDFTNDLKAVLADVQKREPGKKLFLLAHSFGGLIGLKYLLSHKKSPLEGAIISAPLLGIALKVPVYKKVFAELLLHTLPRLQLTDEINPAWLTHDLQVVEAYVNDRLIHKKITPRMFEEMSQTMDWVMGQTGPLACPALFLVPGQDKVVSSAKTLEFFAGLKSRDKQLREYPMMYHEVLNEVDKQKVFEDIVKWLETLKTHEKITEKTTDKAPHTKNLPS